MLPHRPEVQERLTQPNWPYGALVEKALTICVNPHGRGCDVGGNGKVGEPQVLQGGQGSEDTSSHRSLSI